MKSQICHQENPKALDGLILGKYTVSYFHCSSCGFLQTEEPYWLEEAYQNPITFSDVGYVYRNKRFVRILSCLFYVLFGKKGRYLDFAGGYGLFVRMMRDIGFDYYWADKYSQNLFASGFENNFDYNYQVITLFETVEHFVNPKKELFFLANHSDLLIFSTEFYPKSSPKPSEWWYFGLEHGQHVSIFSEKTVKYLANELGWFYYRYGSLNLLSKNPIPKWKLFVMKGARFGLDRWVERQFNSKLQEDYQFVVNKDASR